VFDIQNGMQPFFNSTCPVLYYQNDRPLFVRKLTAILLLITFAVSQYAKQASYMECVLSNYFSAPAGKCDCAKIISKGKNATDSSSLPVLHNHIHVDESYFPSPVISRVFYSGDYRVTSFFTGDSSLRDGIRDELYRPPWVATP